MENAFSNSPICLYFNNGQVAHLEARLCRRKACFLKEKKNLCLLLEYLSLEADGIIWDIKGTSCFKINYLPTLFSFDYIIYNPRVGTSSVILLHDFRQNQEHPAFLATVLFCRLGGVTWQKYSFFQIVTNFPQISKIFTNYT